MWAPQIRLLGISRTRAFREPYAKCWRLPGGLDPDHAILSVAPPDRAALLSAMTFPTT